MPSIVRHLEEAERWLKIMNREEQTVQIIQASAAAAQAELACARFKLLHEHGVGLG